MLRCSTTPKNTVEQAFPGRRCRGEDSNLCQVAERNLQVGAPHQGRIPPDCLSVIKAVSA